MPLGSEEHICRQYARLTGAVGQQVEFILVASLNWIVYFSDGSRYRNLRSLCCNSWRVSGLARGTTEELLEVSLHRLNYIRRRRRYHPGKDLLRCDMTIIGIDMWDMWPNPQSLVHSHLPKSRLMSKTEKRLFDILRSPSCDFITPDDLRPTILGIIVSHPGLAFLKGASEFQDRYAETVIYRIFYSLNPSGANRLSLRDIKKGKLLQSLLEVESEEDVNQCTRFFSYEHFYVIYCKFWDLDTDHDFLLSRDDFLRYGNHSLTYRVADRIFDGAARPLSSGVPNKMGYEDFVWFILSEEDKTSDTALQYWFRACDLNGDDKLTQDELLWFYEEQISRMECLSQETVAFDDIMSQMVDMINPKDAFFFTVRDLKNCRLLAGILFNVMFNLSKFVAFEMRDPFTTKQEREGVSSGLSEWDRYARDEYARLAMEDEDMEDDGMPWAE
eukprot:jgi/Picre1/34910/NNA_002376.t1